MVSCTYYTTISESPTTLSMNTLRLMDFCKHNMSASYFATLFVHSNSKWLDTRCFLLQGSIKAHLTLDLSYLFDLSKYKVHNSFIHGLLDVLVLLLPSLLLLLLLLVQCVVQVSLSLVGKGRSPNYVSGGVGVDCVG